MRKDLRLGAVIGAYQLLRNLRSEVPDDVINMLSEELFSGLSNYEG